MANHKFLEQLIGRWKGTYTLYEPPNETPVPSPSAFKVVPVLAGRFVQIDYDWALRKDKQQGQLLLGYDAKPRLAPAAWLDTWHNGDKIMACTGKAPGAKSLTLMGSFAVPGDPDWGWRTVLTFKSKDTLAFDMDCLPPKGREFLAVRATYTRVKK